MLAFDSISRSAIVLVVAAFLDHVNGAAVVGKSSKIKECVATQTLEQRTSLQNHYYFLRRVSSNPIRYTTDTGAFSVDVTQTGSGQDAQTTFILSSHSEPLNTQERLTANTHALYEIDLDQNRDMPPGGPDFVSPIYEDGFYYLTGLDSCRHTSPKGMSAKTIDSLHVWTA